MSDPRTLVASHDGARLHALVFGAGPPLLLLHGFTGSAAGLAGLARELAADHLVIVPDLLGHGASEAPDDPARHALERQVADLAALLDAAGAARADLLGYSMGGRIALGLAALRPERVRSALLVGASAGLADPAARDERRRADEALADALLRDGLAAFVERWMAQPLFASQRRLGEEALARARAERLAQRPEGLAASLRGVGSGAQPPLHALLARCPVPLLFVAGAEDAKFRALARELAAAVPCGRHAVVAGAGHAVHLEQPAALVAAAREFWSRLQPSHEPPTRRTPT